MVKIPEPQLQEVHLNDRVIACKRFMEHICHERHINLQMELCEENPIVQMDTSLFEQVLINIIKNAAESIGDDRRIFIVEVVSIIERGVNNFDVEKIDIMVSELLKNPMLVLP